MILDRNLFLLVIAVFVGFVILSSFVILVIVCIISLFLRLINERIRYSPTTYIMSVIAINRITLDV